MQKKKKHHSGWQLIKHEDNQKYVRKQKPPPDLKLISMISFLHVQEETNFNYPFKCKYYENAQTEHHQVFSPSYKLKNTILTAQKAQHILTNWCLVNFTETCCHPSWPMGTLNCVAGIFRRRWYGKDASQSKCVVTVKTNPGIFTQQLCCLMQEGGGGG